MTRTERRCKTWAYADGVGRCRSPRRAEAKPEKEAGENEIDFHFISCHVWPRELEILAPVRPGGRGGGRWAVTAASGGAAGGRRGRTEGRRWR